MPAGPKITGYDVVELLSRGEELDVYAVHSLERDCLCVAKLPRIDRPARREAVDRLRTEAERLIGLSHPGLVRGYELITGRRPVLIMETLGGETFGHLMDQRRTRLSVDDLAELGRQLCSVIGYLHRRQILHLDLKPANLVVESGRVTVLDLSHAGPAGSCPPGYGTDDYMPPEQWDGGEVGPASDVHGIGGVLFRGLTRQRPYRLIDGPDADRDTRPAGRRLDLGPLRSRRAVGPIAEVVEACLAPRPADRPTLAELATALA